MLYNPIEYKHHIDLILSLLPDGTPVYETVYMHNTEGNIIIVYSDYKHTGPYHIQYDMAKIVLVETKDVKFFRRLDYTKIGDL